MEKEYSPDDGSEWPEVEPGYIISVSPESGSEAGSGEPVTLTVSRGLDHGDSVEVPDVSGFTTDEAVTRLGKWLRRSGCGRAKYRSGSRPCDLTEY